MIHLFAHGDIDGLFSAAILADFLCRRRKRNIIFRTINYDAIEKGWGAEILPKNSFIVDFKYNPTAFFFVDHHESGMVPFERPSKKTKIFLFDPQRKSCAGMLYNYFKALHSPDWDPGSWKEAVSWCDMIDSAGYKSPEQVVLSREPALKIRLALMDREVDPVGMIEKLIKHRGNLEKVAEIYQEAWEKRQKKIELCIERYPRLITRINDVGYLDLTKGYTPRDRYVPFFVFKNLGYMVTITGWQGQYQVSLSKNPWQEVEDPINLAELVQRYKGGGHKNAAGADSQDEAFIKNAGMEIFSTLAYRGQKEEVSTTSL